VPTFISSSASDVSPGVGEVGAVLAAADDMQNGGEDEENGLEDMVSDYAEKFKLNSRRVDEFFRLSHAHLPPLNKIA
jgi:hypothetical protein